MILGIGIDIIEISRIEEMVKKWGDSFLTKIFTEKEIAYCRSKAFPEQNFSVRFAAKESFFKAASHLPNFQFSWKYIEVSNDISGKPEIIVLHPINDLFENKKVHLSLSHSNDSAVACVVIEG